MPSLRLTLLDRLLVDGGWWMVNHDVHFLSGKGVSSAP